MEFTEDIAETVKMDPGVLFSAVEGPPAADGLANTVPKVTVVNASAKEKKGKKLNAGYNIRSWLRVESSGVTSLVQADKYKLTHKLGVQTRDLRLMDPNLTSTYPAAILVRDRALVVNLEHIKVIITTSCVYVMNPEDENVLPFITELKLKLFQAPMHTSQSFPNLAEMGAKGFVEPTSHLLEGNKGMLGIPMPFELRALEVCLEAICSCMNRLASDLEAAAYPALDALTARVSSHNLERVRRIKSRLTRLTTRVETIREVLEKFLDDDEDMHDMNLTAKEQSQAEALMQPPSSSSSSSSSSHSSTDSDDEEEIQEVEMLLEAYFMHIDNTYNRLQTLNEYIDDTEDLVNLKLDQHRNQLIGIDLILTAFTTSLAMVTAVAGYFGMNLSNGVEEREGVFMYVCVATSVGAALFLILFVAFVWYKKLMVY